MRPDTARARAIVGRIFEALTAEPPLGVDRAYLDGFRQRAEPALIRLLERRIAEARARKAAQPPEPDPEEDPAPAPIPPERWREGLRAVTAQGQHGALVRVVRMEYAAGAQGAPTVGGYADLRLDSGRKLSLGPRTPIYPERGPAPAVLPDPDLDGDGVFRSPEDAWQELRSRLSSLEHFEAKARHARGPQRSADCAHRVFMQRGRLERGLLNLARAGQPLTHRGQALVARRAQALAERGGGGATPEQRAQAAAGCAEVLFRLPEHGDVRVVCGQAGRRDVWHNVFVGQRRYGFNGGRWARGEAPPPAVLAAVRERGITVFG